MLGWQAEGAAPLVLGEPVAAPETVASAIRIGNPASWHLAVEAAEASGGRFGSVNDEEILVRAARAGRHRGHLRRAGLRGERRRAAQGRRRRARLPRARRVVVTVTGHGLKDIDTALSTFTDLVDTVVEADVAAAAAAAGLA